MSETETTTETATETATPTTPIETKPDGEQPIAGELLDKLAALKSIVKISQLLGNGIFPGAMAEDLLVSKSFIEKLHAPILKEAQEHPDWKRATDPEGYKKEQKEKAAAEVALAKAEEKREKKAEKKKGILGKVLGSH